jgi:hypothetical protein
MLGAVTAAGVGLTAGDSQAQFGFGYQNFRPGGTSVSVGIGTGGFYGGGFGGGFGYGYRPPFYGGYPGWGYGYRPVPVYPFPVYRPVPVYPFPRPYPYYGHHHHRGW